MNFQAGNLRIYSLAYEEWHDPEYLKAAQDVQRFLTTFLASPEGAFYTSMDADLIEGKHSAAYFKLDDTGRRKLGIPRIDKHVYSRENGWAIEALAVLYAASGDRQYLDQAVRAAQWIIENRKLDGGGFRHDAKDSAGPYLADTLTMGRAFLTIYEVTGDRAWLARAESAAKFINANFAGDQAGFITSKAPTDRSYTPRPEREENIALARFSQSTFALHGKPGLPRHGRTGHAVSSGAHDRENTCQRVGTLLADREFSSDPIHITIVGHKDDPAAQALFHAAAAYPSGYLRLEWWDTREGGFPIRTCNILN